ncbi:MAG: hypothetical protein M3348_16575 [Acidobacteriota bacterium]|nr:hypothetical protein [Acidobacteriota bacterium]
MEERGATSGGKGERQEVRTYQVPVPADNSVNGSVNWSGEKTTLYEKVVSVISDDIKQYRCNPGELVKVVLPDFNVGDPAVYVLVIPPGASETSIEWVGFMRVRSTGEYDAYHVKSIDLTERTKYRRSMIEQKKMRQLRVSCPK